MIFNLILFVFFITAPLYIMVLRAENQKLRQQVRQLARTPKIPSWVNGG